MPLTIELIPDPNQGGFTARLPDIPANGEGETENEDLVYFATPGRAEAPATH